MGEREAEQKDEGFEGDKARKACLHEWENVRLTNLLMMVKVRSLTHSSCLSTDKTSFQIGVNS